MAAYAHAFDDGEVHAWLNRMMTRQTNDGYSLWALIRKSVGRFIGQCGLTNQQFADQPVVEIGYLLERPYWHCGYAIEAATGAKAYAFDYLHIPTVWSIIRDTNLASMNVAIRNGMVVRGHEIRHYYGIDMMHYGFAVERPAR